MEVPSLNEAMRIENSRGAAVFNRPSSWRTLQALADGPATAGDVARAAGIRLNLACYHLSAMVRLGFIRVAGHRRRAGRSSRVYELAAKAFFVPAELSSPLGEQLTAELRELMRASDQSNTGELFYVDGTGRLRAQKVAPGEEGNLPASSELWMELQLDFNDRSALMKELHAVVRRFAERRSGSRYLFHAALAARAADPQLRRQ